MIEDIEKIQALAEEFKNTNTNILKMFLEDELPKLHREIAEANSLPAAFVEIGDQYRLYEDATWNTLKGHDPANGNDQSSLREAVNG